MTTQTEAQQIADKLEEEATFDIHHEAKTCMTKAAAELRRLEAANAELMAALKDTLDFCEHHSNRWDGARGKHIFSVVEAARAAIAKHGGAA